LVAGGINASGVLASTEIYEPNTNIWKTVGSLHYARREHSAFVSEEGRVYVAGGGTPFDPTNSVEEFDPVQEIWVAASSLVVGQSNAALVRAGFSIYMLGGYMGNLVPSAQVQVFDEQAGSWSGAKPMLVQRDYLSADALDTNTIVAIGGFDGKSIHSSVEVFDLKLHQWSMAGSLLVPTWDHRTAVVMGAGILVVGGVGSDGPTQRTELVQPGRASLLAQPLATARYGSYLVRLQDGRILVGGGASRFNAEGESWLASTEISCEPVAN
jgi:N-acetylneuraminic acid mutarotase